METLRDLFLNPSLEQSFLNIQSFSNYVKLHYNEKNVVATFATDMAAGAAFILGASDAILQSLDHQTLPCCMPRKGSLTLDHNGLIGLVQKVNKHHTCLLGTKALKGNLAKQD